MSLDYPNMSYCMFQNTLSAMRQILESVDQEGQTILEEMDHREKLAFRELYGACEAFLEVAEDVGPEL